MGGIIGGSETRLTTNTADQNDPAISGDIIVYTDYRGADADIWYYDLGTGSESSVTTAPGSQVLTDVSGGTIAYNDFDLCDVFIYDTVTGTNTNITNNAGTSRAQNPAIGGKLVAWEDSRNIASSSIDIYAKDLATGEERRVSDLPGTDRASAVAGGIIVFASCAPFASQVDIYAYDWATRTTTQIENTLDDSRDPDTNGLVVVYSRRSASSGEKDIYYYDLTTGVEKQLLLDGDQVNPNISGDYVVFEDIISGLYHVRLWHVPTGCVFDLDVPTTSSQFLNDIDGNRIVYTDDRGGQYDIYLYTLNTPTYTITATAGTGGSITPSGAVTVNIGDTQEFTIAPNPGYSILDVTVDGSSVGAVPSYTFTSVTDDHTIAASFTGGVNPIVVTSPNGGENWEVFSVQTITWSSTGVSGRVKIELSRDGGATWATIIPMTPNDGSQRWIVLRGATTQARIKVSSIADPALFDISDANFTIVEPSITVTSPNGGENWKIGSTQTITWDSTSVLLVKIELSRDGGATWSTIAASIANHGDKTWKVTGPTTHARIRIVSLSNSASDISNADFTITKY
jgi:beta propeller repeat protein